MKAIIDTLDQENLTKKKSPKKRKILIISCSIIIVILLAIIIYAGVKLITPVENAKNSLKNIEYVFTDLANDIKNKDLSKIDERFQKINDELSSIDSNLSEYDFLKDQEFTKGYYDNINLVHQVIPLLSEIVEHCSGDTAPASISA